MRVAKGGFSGLEAPKIFGLRFGDESQHKNVSTALSGGVCLAESVGAPGSRSPVCLLNMIIDQETVLTES